MAEPKFVRLTLHNNWENLSYKRGTKTVEIPKAAKKITVKWPDGTVTTEKLIREHYYANVNDMGHSYDVRGEIPAIEFKHNGTKLQARLSDLKSVVLPEGTEIQ